VTLAVLAIALRVIRARSSVQFSAYAKLRSFLEKEWKKVP